VAVSVAPLRLLLVQMRRVEQHQPRKVARGRGADDLTAKPALHQERNASAMVEMGMGQQQHVDIGGVEAEIVGVLLVQLPPALEHAAIHEDAPPPAP
jgi:hypothetical protein